MAERRRRTLVLPLLLMLLGLLLALVACSEVPSTGRVHAGREVDVPGEGPYVQLLASGPRPGDSPLRVVRGFLQALASLEDDSAVARQYLATADRDRWDPSAGVTLYDNDPTVTKGGVPYTLVEQAGGLVRLQARNLGSLDGRGRYSARPATPVLNVVFELVREGGEWRITHPPAGLLLTRDDIARGYRPVNVYFLDPTQTLLVPDRVFLPVRAGLATALLRRLLEGPSSWLVPGVSTAVPPETRLEVSSVPIEDGVALVRLSPSVLAASTEARRALSAQIVWTLQQVPQVRAVSLIVDGAPLAVPGVGEVQVVSDWPSFRPGVIGSSIDPFVRQENRLLRLHEQLPTGVPGVAGAAEPETAFRSYAVNPSEDKVAAVAANGKTLLVAALEQGAVWEPVLIGRSLSAPSWDGLGRLWVVDATTKGSVLRRVWAGRVDAARLPQLNGATITAVRVARDGVRLALQLRDPETGGTSLQVGRVHGGTGTNPLVVDGRYEIGHGLSTVNNVSWASSDRLAVLVGAGTAQAQVYLIDVDSYATESAGLVANAVTLGAALDQPLVVGTAGGEVLRSRGTRWELVAEGTDPSYPR